ncbi:MAG: YtxC-like family protein [Pelotomaculum sp. PtaB.Bin013]|uniref:Sporulation protein YtxC n=1 Tax=Pelotomaculum isophthalicicum JI TaxID=947010 RepID=A0A9X4GZB9_9FIRM|nr:putative sporulation protein YtxC [Pelotomaculum isophthalicicum]MDF9408587.1 putative sporulation protein YtxC [Pelotomaculum isophthalicicum JI]OPX82788.1 MAG: YtxC-like family protein [Pelotomaculum sp. PtaB.Bin013]
MAQIISIGSTQHIDLLKDKLGRGLMIFERNGFKINLEERSDGKFTFFSCCLDGFPEYCQLEDDPQIIIKKYVADLISDIILSHWEVFLLKNIICENYYYYGDEEKKIIYNYALQHINRKSNEPRKSVYWFNRKRRILNKILDYLKLNNSIIIDGFIRFRLKEYINELKDATDKAVDDFLLEREYREFIELLKYFVEIQEPRAYMVHVLINNVGAFKLYDDKTQPVRSDYLGGFLVDMMDSEINYEDMLVSALVTIAPQKIIFHHKKNDRYSATIETIKKVFDGRVSECPGCELCTPLNN